MSFDHVLEVGDGGWSLEHPQSCRDARLLDCATHERVVEAARIFALPEAGRYRVQAHKLRLEVMPEPRVEGEGVGASTRKGEEAEPSATTPGDSPSPTIPFTSAAVRDYLDGAIRQWREYHATGEDQLLAACYIDAFQSVRVSLFGELL